MAKKIKTSTKPKTVKRNRKEESSETEVPYEMPPVVTPIERNSPKKRSNWALIALGVLVLGLIGLFLVNRSMFIAAVVNGQPIFRWDLNKVLTTRYGQQTLDGMITEKLIADEASKSNVTVSQDEINQRGEEILSSFGSSLSVDEFLQLQGLSRDEFDNQLKLQITVQKLLSKDLTITDQDITNYIASNAATLVATEPAALREEAKTAILDTHVSEKFQTWLEEIKEKATVQKYL